MSSSDTQQVAPFTSLTTPLLAYVSNCTKLTTEVSRLKNPQKIHTEYGIPAQEKILVYCRSGIPFVTMALNSVLFTDQAFYCQVYEKEAEHNTANRIPYLDFGKYLFCQHKKRGAMYITNEAQEFEVLRGTLVMKNTAAIETCEALETIQRTILSSGAMYQKQFQCLIQWTLDFARTSMKTGMLSDKASHMLYAMTKFPTHCSNAWILLAENQFRLCSLEQYKRFLSDNSTEIPSATYAEIENSVDRFSKNLLKDLANLHAEFQPLYLNKVLKSDSVLPAHLHAVSYAQIRYGQFHQASGGIYGLRSPDSDPDITKLSEFLCLYGHRRMASVYKLLTEGTPLEKKDTHLADGLGLTPLHYALIMRCDDIATSLMVKKWWHEPSIRWVQDPVASLLPYHTLAEIIQTPIRNQVFIFTHPDVWPLADKYFSLVSERDHLPEKIETAHTAIQTAKRTCDKMKAAGKPSEKIAEAEEQLYRQQERLHDLLHRQIELESDIPEAQKVADTALHKALRETEHLVANLRLSKDPVVRLFFDIYTEKILLQALHELNYADETVCFYTHSNYLFMLPENIPLDCTHRSVFISFDGEIIDAANSEEKQTVHTKKHLDTWFSTKAWTDIHILKEEFRELAKQYHPDVNQEVNTTEIFQEILAEYHIIEEKLTT